MRQMAFSKATYGPGARTNGVLDHIKKEVEEVRENGGSAEEWVDLVILSLDGLTRQLSFCNEKTDQTKRVSTSADISEAACNMIVEKQDRNENRSWPDWRTADLEKAIEHDRTQETAP
jgi:K+-transporting ATPase c subunit